MDSPGFRMGVTVMRNATVVGVHPVEADRPCHLIELTICDPDREFTVDDLTQVDENVEKDLWQAAYDEGYLDAQSLEPLPRRPGHQGIIFDPGVRLEPPDRKECRLALFFHYLDLANLWSRALVHWLYHGHHRGPSIWRSWTGGRHKAPL
jgi:hypothetical protein